MSRNPDPTPISDSDDPRLAPFRSLRARTERGEEIPVADGLRVLETLVSLGAPIESVVTTPEDLPAVSALLASVSPVTEAVIFVVARKVVSQLVGYRYHGGVMASLVAPATTIPLEALGGRVIALARLDKGDNVGAIARSALAFGFTGLLFDRAGTSPFGRSALRVSRGTVFGLAVRGTDDLATDLTALAARGVTPVGAVQNGSVEPGALAPMVGGSFALVLGNEGEGLSAAVAETLEVTVGIPIDGRVESLNVAAAAAILCHALRPRSR